MGFESTSSGVAASIFLGLYTLYLLLAINVVRHEGFKFIYRILLMFGLFRVAGQLCGVAFSVLGVEHWQWLIAYLVFTAEGYFTLIVAAFYFIVQCQVKQTGSSWLLNHKDEVDIKSGSDERGSDENASDENANAEIVSYEKASDEKGGYRKKGDEEASGGKWKKRKSSVSWSAVFYMFLIPANAFIVGGGSLLTGANADELNKETGKVSTSKALRTTGQTIFLIQTVIVVLLLIYVYVKEKIRGRTMYLLFAASPFLLVRGIFGIMSIYVDKMNYYKLSNYTAEGLTSDFVAYEYCLATTMEFVAACLLISNYYLDREAKVVDKEKIEEFEKESIFKKILTILVLL